jgi:hypothetical protein
MRKTIIAIVSIVLIFVFYFIYIIHPSSMTTTVSVNPSGTMVITGDDTETEPEPDEDEEIYIPLALILSETGHFYTHDITVVLSASKPDALIFYTLDGSPPTRESTLYTTPLSFSVGRGINAVSLRVIAVYGDTVTPTLTHTYFIGRDVNNRFDTLVFSLSSDPHGLYDYDDGIFVTGRLRDDYIRANPGVQINPPAPANFNIRGMEGERATALEIFTPDGERVISQEAGIRVHGGWSRATEQKSIRLIARRDYAPGLNRFHFDFFDSPVVEYQTLILRNGGNDRDFGMLRHEVASVLARNAGLQVVTPVRPVAIFLNGEYYGFAWLQVRVNDRYLQDLFDAPTRFFDNIGMGERWIDTDDAKLRREMTYMNSFANKDLTDDAIFAQLEEIVDIDNLLYYYAFQIFMGNEDWPHNNLRRWRYSGEQVPGLAPELDGRWRYIFFDLDWTLGLYGDNFRKPTFHRVLEMDNPRSPLLKNILTRTDMADRFSMMMCDIAANVVNHTLVQEVLNDLFGAAQNEIFHALTARRYAHWVSVNSVQNNHNEMLNFARRRHEFIFANLVGYFGFSADMFSVDIVGGEAVIGTQHGTTSRYFVHLEVPVTPVLPESAEFSHWILNGVRIYEKNITVSVEDTVKDVVRLELVTR